ncbi:L-2-hydroxyglutarate oxidase [Paeniglutamicibacter cryotolerans]|uniref:L-2-hydroxyglutarate oxidase n=1 Tax=Paeniglutamicibacter cryotolerans TaxID=670079 RepID=A0A839QMF2_9MICC|nr:L-2-hydroxyglutarate oxidase [Paeniglutamicibacter cryotolerans]MBB2995785.1 L-2-hydroxyglutarate oxidase [Paeniglutamicibacter cryotolerans]
MGGGNNYDYVVVGAGIVGLATARELLHREPGATVAVLEKEAGVATHQTGHNSGVIHAGIYYEPGSLKARLCREGEQATKEFCRENGIRYETTGKLVVATNESEAARLGDLHDRALLNGINVRPISGLELGKIEPNIAGTAALLVASTGIVDYRKVAGAMAREITGRGGRIACSTRVTGIRELPDRVEVATVAGETLSAGRLLVCGGLQADRLLRMGGVEPDFRIVPFRGEYYRLPERLSGLVRHLIYPVPDPNLPFLGVHLSPTIGGSITVGPNAVVGLAREGYAKYSVSGRDAADMFGFPGFWKVMAANLSSGFGELRDSVFKHGYLAACRKYCPSLEARDLAPYPAGIRAQAVMADGSLVHDFLIRSTARQLHVANAPSPAATSAVPIARMIVAMLAGEGSRRN